MAAAAVRYGALSCAIVRALAASDRTVAELAELLGEDVQCIRVTLLRLRKRRLVVASQCWRCARSSRRVLRYQLDPSGPLAAFYRVLKRAESGDPVAVAELPRFASAWLEVGLRSMRLGLSA